MARSIPSTGTISYNNFPFPAAVTTDVSMTPEYDRANRTVISITQRIHVTCVIVPSDFRDASNAILPGFVATFETNLRILEKNLSTNGQKLVFNGVGFGNLNTTLPPGTIPAGFDNNNQDYPDLKFGPKVKINSMRNLGGGQAIFLDWEVEVCRFPYGVFSGSGSNPQYPCIFGQLCFSILWTMDDNYLLSRTISGVYDTLVIRKNLTGNLWYETVGVASNHRKDILNGFIGLEGFRRSQSDQLSDDRRTITFTITDTEIDSPTPYFPGCSEISVVHRVHTDTALSAGNSGGALYWNTLSGRIRVEPGVVKSVAWKAFAMVVTSRLISTAQLAGTDTDKNASNSLVPVIKGLTITEEVFGRQLSFEISYLFSTTFKKLFQVSGLFSNNGLLGNWAEWNKQREKTRQRFLTGVPNFVDSDDLIVNFALQGNPFEVIQARKAAEGTDLPSPLSGKPPSDDQSWLMFGNILFQIVSPNTFRLSTITDAVAGFLEGVGMQTPKSEDMIIDSGGYNDSTVVMFGAATKVANKIITPTLTAIQTVEGGKEDITPKDWIPVRENVVIGNTLSGPLYYSRWVKTYHLKGAKIIPASIKVNGEPPGFAPQGGDLRR